MFLSRLKDYYEDAQWQAIAAGFFEKSGKMLDPKELRDKWDSAPFL